MTAERRGMFKPSIAETCWDYRTESRVLGSLSLWQGEQEQERRARVDRVPTVVVLDWAG